MRRPIKALAAATAVATALSLVAPAHADPAPAPAPVAPAPAPQGPAFVWGFASNAIIPSIIASLAISALLTYLVNGGSLGSSKQGQSSPGSSLQQSGSAEKQSGSSENLKVTVKKENDNPAEVSVERNPANTN